MCSLEEKLKEDGEMPSYYKRYVDDTLQAATSFLDVLNSKYHSLNFTMETDTDNTSFPGNEHCKERHNT